MSIMHYEKEFFESAEALGKEYLLTSGTGAYSASTLCNCNTRKYHGLFIAPQPQIDDNDHVFVGGLDEKVSCLNVTSQLATHKYPGTYYPEGYLRIKEYDHLPFPTWVYQADNCLIQKELVMPEGDDAVMIRYTVLEANEKAQLELIPFLAFRCVHKLKSANHLVNRKIQEVNNGLMVRLLPEYDAVFIQTSQLAEFVSAPDWYYNIEYPVEQTRGYDYMEDQYVPGRFRITLKKGDKLVVYLGLKEINPRTLGSQFSNLAKRLQKPENHRECLEYAADQFIIKRGPEVKVKAGYYWFGSWGRDTFISLPGLTLALGKVKEFREIINCAVADLKYGLFPNLGKGDQAIYNSVDAPLWFIWAIQQYASYTGREKFIWRDYGKYLSDILDHYAKGTLFNIRMDADGMIFSGQEGVALTWMDAVVNGIPVTPRTGKCVEINALWYNAVCFCLEMATLAGDESFCETWKNYPEIIKKSFADNFTSEDVPFMADFVNNNVKDWSLRPNQVFALSLPNSPVPESMRKQVLDLVRDVLLTPKGLRTLSPQDINYKEKCEGNSMQRDQAYHQGTVWPWLSGHFAEAYLKEFGSNGLPVVQQIYDACGDMLRDQCLCTINEIYNGDEPHKPVGAVAQAWSVAEYVRMGYLIEQIAIKEKDTIKELV